MTNLNKAPLLQRLAPLAAFFFAVFLPFVEFIGFMIFGISVANNGRMTELIPLLQFISIIRLLSLLLGIALAAYALTVGRASIGKGGQVLSIVSIVIAFIWFLLIFVVPRIMLSHMEGL